MSWLVFHLKVAWERSLCATFFDRFPLRNALLLLFFFISGVLSAQTQVDIFDYEENEVQTNVLADQTISFCSSEGPPGIPGVILEFETDIYSYSVDWGDGSPVENVSANFNDDVLTHSYPEQGNYEIELSFEASNVAPTENIDFNVNFCFSASILDFQDNVIRTEVKRNPEPIRFCYPIGIDDNREIKIEFGGTVNSGTINWGNGTSTSITSGTIFSNTYSTTNDGPYTITVQNINGSNNSDASVELSFCNQVDLLSFSDNLIQADLENNPNAFITYPTGESLNQQVKLRFSNIISSYIINWGDGTTDNTSHNSDIVLHNYATPGTYSVSITSINGNTNLGFSFTITLEEINPPFEVDIKDVFGSTIQSDLGGNSSPVFYCIPAGDFGSLNPYELTLEFENPITQYRIDWGDGSAIETEPLGFSGNEITHSYDLTGSNTIDNPFYELEIIEINSSPFDLFKLIQIDNSTGLISTANEQIYCGIDGETTVVELKFFATNLSPNTDWQVDWGDGTLQRVSKNDVSNIVNGFARLYHSYTYSNSTFQYEILLSPGNSLSDECISTDFANSPVVIQFQESIDPDFSVTFNGGNNTEVTEICADGTSLQIQRTTNNQLDNTLDEFDEVKWSIIRQRGSDPDVTLLEIPFSTIPNAPISTGSYSGINTLFTFDINPLDISENDKLLITLTEKNACGETFLTKEIDVIGLPSISNLSSGITNDLTCQDIPFNIMWDAEPDVDYYYLLYSNSNVPDSDDFPNDVDDRITPSFQLNQTEGTYTFWIKAENDAGCVNINSLPLEVLPDLIPDFEVNLVTTTPAQDGCGSVVAEVINLSTIPAGSNPSFVYEYSTEADFSVPSNIETVDDADNISLSNTILPSLNYYFRLTATTDQGCTYEKFTGIDPITVLYQPSSTDIEIVDIMGAPPSTPNFEFCEGDNVTLRVNGASSFTGVTPTLFEWNIDGTIQTTTTNELTTQINSSYTLKVKEIVGSCEIELVEDISMIKKPVINEISVSGPTNFCEEGSNQVTLTAVIDPGTPADIINWYQDGSFYATGTSIILDEFDDSGTYSAEAIKNFSNGSCSGELLNLPQVFQIQEIPDAPGVSLSGPTSFCEGPGQSITLSASQSGAVNVSEFEWYKDDSPNDPIFVDRVTDLTLTDPDQSGTYFAIAIGSGTDLCESPGSTPIIIEIQDSPERPNIQIGTLGTNICEGNGSIQLTSDIVASEYKWFYENDTEPLGTIDQELTLNLASQSGDYYVIAVGSAGCESIPSAPISVTINAIPGIPDTPTEINDISGICENEISGIVLETESLGPSIEYRWYRSDTDDASMSSVFAVSFNNPPTTDISNNLNVGDNYFFVRAVKDQADPLPDCAGDFSESILITVYPEPEKPTIAVSGDSEVCEGNSITFNVATPGSFTYKWFVDGDIDNSSTNGTFTLSSVGENQDVTAIRVSADNCESEESIAETVTIYELPLNISTISIDGGFTQICENGSVDIRIDGSQSNIAYTLLGGPTSTTIDGTGGSILLNTGVLPIGTGTYTFQVEAETKTSPACSRIMSPSLNLDVNPPPSAVSFTLDEAQICSGTKANLNIDITGGTPPFTIIYTTDGDNSRSISSNSNNIQFESITLSRALNDKDTYEFEITSFIDASGCTFTVTDKPSVTVDEPVSISIDASDRICYNQNAQVEFDIDGGIGDYSVGFRVNSGPLISLTGPSPLSYNGSELQNLLSDATITLVSATTINGCEIPAFQNITTAVIQVDDPTFILSADNTEICSYDNLNLSLAISGGDGPYDIQIVDNRNVLTIPFEINGYSSNSPIPVLGIPNIVDPITFTVTSVVDATTGCSVREEVGGDNTVLVTVNPKPGTPSIIVENGISEICEGGSNQVKLTSSLQEANFNYEWVKVSDGMVVGTDPELVLTTVQNESYQVKITTDPAGCIGNLSTAQSVTINALPPQPTIVIDEESISSKELCENESTILRSSTIDADSYQWYLGTNPIPGAENQSFSPILSGNYSVETISSSSCVSPRSASVSITFNPVPQQPDITALTPVAICDDVANNNEIQLRSSNNDNLADSYEWFKIPDLLNPLAETGNTITLNNISQDGSYRVRVVTADGCTGQLSDEFSIQINSIPPKPDPITTDQPNDAICADGSSTIILTADTDPLAVNYIWFRGTTQVAKGTGNTLTLTSTDQPGDYTVQYEAAASTLCLSEQSDPITISINPVPGIPAITNSGSDAICEDGSTIVLEVVSTPANADNYNWYKLPDTSNPIGTGASITLNDTDESGDYVVSAVGITPTLCEGTASSSYTVLINPVPQTPAITASATEICDDGGTSFITLTASNPDGNIDSYQWFQDGLPVGTGPSLIRNQSIHTGTYTVQGFGIDDTNCPTSISAGVEIDIYVIPPAPVITGDASLCAGETNKLFVIDNSVSGASFDWTLPSGVNQVNGGDGLSFLIVDFPSPGTYSIEATQTRNGCISSVGEIEVIILDPSITAGINGTFILCENQQNVEFSIESPNGGSTYAWNVPNGASFSTITPSRIEVDFGTAAQSGASPVIEVIETNLAGCVSTPLSVPLTINELPSAVLSGDATVCFGKSTDLLFDLTGVGPWEVTYAANSGGSPNVITINVGATVPMPFAVPVSPTTTTNYSLISVTDGSSNNCEAVSVTGNAFVEVLPAPTLFAGTQQSIAQGSFAALNPTADGTFTTVQWSSDRPGDGSFNNANLLSPIFTPDPAQTGTFTLTVTISDANGFCDPVPDEIVIEVNPAGTVDAGANQTICDDGSTAVLSATNPPDAGYTNIVWESDRPGEGAITGALSNNATFQPNPGATGDFVLTAKYTDTDGSDGFLPDTEDNLTITVNALPQVSFDDVSDIIVCEGSGDIDLDFTLTGNGPWEVKYRLAGNAEQTISVPAGNNNFNLTVPAPNIGNNVYTITSVSENDNVSCTGNVLPGSEEVNIIRRALPTVSITSPTNIDLCDDGSTATISVELTGTGPWDLTYFDGTDDVTINNITTNSYDFQVSGTAGGSTTYSITEVVEMNGANCNNTISGTSVNVTKNLRPTGVLSVLSADATICEGENTNLNVVVSGTGPWTITYTDGSDTFTFDGSTTNPVQVIPISPDLGSTNYSLVEILDETTSCVSTGADLSGVALITVNEEIQVDDLNDRTILQGTTTTLTAVATGDFTTIQWNADRPGLFSSPGTLTTDFSPSETGVYNIEVQVSDNTTICTAVTRTMQLTVVESADAILSAGINGESCQAQPILLAATVGSSYTDEAGDQIIWSITQGTGSIGPAPSDPTNPAKAEYQPASDETGTVIFEVSVSDQSTVAPDQTDEVEFDIFPTPTATIVSNDEFICNDGSSEATIVISLTGKAPWSLTYTDGTSDFTIPITTPTYNLQVSGVPGATTNYALKSVSSTSLTNCENTGLSSSVNVINRELPTAQFGSTTAITLCDDGSQASLPLDLSGTGPWTVVWTDDFNNVENTTTVNSLPFNLNVPGAAGETVTYSIVRVTENNGVSCLNNDLGSLGLDLELEVTKNRRPTAVLSGNPIICELPGKETTTLSVSLTGVGPFDLTYSVSSVQTTVNIAANPNGDPSVAFSSDITVEIPDDDGTGTYNFTLASLTDNGTSCVSTAGDLSGVSQVTVNPEIVVDPLSDLSMLQAGTLPLLGIASGSFNTIQWSIAPDNGTFTSPNSLSTTFLPEPDQVGTFVVTLTASDNTNVCTTDGTSSFNLTINPSGDATVNAGNDETVCEGDVISLDAEIGIAYTDEVGDVIQWSTPNGTGTLIQDGVDPSLATYTPDGNESSTVQFIVSVEDASGVAEDKSDIVLYTIRPLPGAEFLTSSESICEDGTTEITVRFTGQGPWDFKYEKGGVEVVETGISTTTFTIPVSGSDGTELYSITEVSNSFISNSISKTCLVPISGEEVTITALPLPTVSIADQSTRVICDDGSTASIEIEVLNGVAPWTITYLEDGVEKNQSFNTANYTWEVPGTAGETISYQITGISEGSTQNCINDLTALDLSVEVTKNKRPTAILSGTQTICEVDGTETAELSIEMTGVGPFDVNYEVNSVPASVVIPANPNGDPDTPFTSTFTVNPGSVGIFSYNLSSVVDNGNTPSCSSQGGDLSGTPVVTVSPKIEIGLLNDATILQGDVLNLNGVVSGTFSDVQWSILPDEGSFSPEDNVNTTFNPTPSQVGTFTITLTASDAICATQSESFELTINSIDNAVVDAGSPQTVCENENILLEATIGSAFTDVTWSSNGVGTLVQNVSEPEKATYFPEANETGIVQFTVLATDDNNIAPDKSDNVLVTINALPEGEIISGNSIICNDVGSTATITVSLTGVGPWDIEYTDGVDNFTISDISTPTHSFDVPGRTGEDVTYSLTTVTEKNGPSCVQTISGEEVIITRRELPTASITAVDVNELCDDGSLSTLTIELTGQGPWNLTWKEDISNIENLIPNIPAGTNTYTLQVPGVLGETATYSIVKVTESNGVTCENDITGEETVITKYRRPTAILSGNPTICEGEQATLNLELTGTGPWEVTYTDGGSDSDTFITSDASTTFNVNPPAIGSSSYTITSVVDNGTSCESISADLSGNSLVTVKQLIDVSEITNKSILQGSSLNLTGIVVGAFTEVEWSISPDEGSFLPNNSLNTLFTPTPTQVGDFTVTLRAIDNPSNICSSDEESFTITIQPIDNAIVVAGNDQITCENDRINLEATIGSVYTDITWSTNGSGTLVQDSFEPNKAFYDPDIDETGPVQFTVEAEDINGIAPTKSDNVIATINELPTVEVVSTDQIICNDGSTATLSLSLTGSGPWDLVYSDGVTDIPVNGITSQTLNIPLPASVGTIEYTVKSIIENDGASCTGTIIGDASILVTTNELPTASISGIDTQELCDDGSVATIQVDLTGTGPWDITWKDDFNNVNNVIQDITTSPYELEVPGIVGQTVNYSIVRVIEKNGTNCIVDIADESISLTKFNRPTGALSGTTTICEGENALLTLSLTGTGPWEVAYTDGSNTFNETIANATSNITVTPAVGSTTYNLISVSDANTCTSQGGDLSGTPLVTVNPEIQVSAIADQSVLQGLSIDFLGEASGAFTQVEWTANRPGVFSEPNSIATSFTPDSDQIGEYVITFRAVDDLGNICSSDEVSFTLSITPAGNADVFAGVDQISCEDELVFLEAIVGSAYTDVAWSVVSGTGLLIQDPIEQEKATYQPANGETGIVQFSVLATDDNNIAPDKSDNVLVTINPAPSAEIISLDDVICNEVGSVSSITVSLTGTGPWNITYNDGISDFDIDGITTPTFSFDVTGRTGEDVTYSLVSVTELNGATCTENISGSDVIITRNELPTATITNVSDTELCDDGSTATITVSLTGNGPWSLTWKDNINDVDNLIPDIPAGNNTYQFDVPGIAGETATYSLVSVSENDGEICNTVINDESVDITKFERPTAVLSENPTVCEGEQATLSIELTGIGPWEVNYSDGGSDIGSFNTTEASTTFDVSPQAVGSASYVITSVTDNGTGCVSTPADLSGNSLVTVNQEINISPLSDETLLQGNSINLSATVSGAYNTVIWSISPEEGTFLPDGSLNTLFTPDANQVGTFIITLQAFDDPDNICSSDTESLTLVINSSDDAIVDAGAPQITCENDQVQLSALIGPAYTDITWNTNGSGTLTQDPVEPFRATYDPVPDETGTIQFTVLGEDVNGIAPPRSDNVLVTINKLPTAEIVNSDQVICNDGSTATMSVSFTGTGPWDIVYSDGSNDFTVEDITTQTHNVTLPGIVGSTTYTLKSVLEKDGADCSGSIIGNDQITITTNELPTATILGVDSDELCDDGSTATIQIELTGNGPWDLTWRDDFNNVNNLVADISSSPYELVVPGRAGQDVTYSITRIVEKDGTNCEVNISGEEIVITKFNRPTGVLSGSVTQCEGSTVDLSIALTGTGPWDIIYTDGISSNLVTLNNSSDVISVNPPVGSTTYSLVNIVDNGTGCESTSGDLSGTPLVTIKPEIQVVDLDPRTMLQGLSINLIGEASGAFTSVEWSSDRPGVFSSPNSLTTTFTPQPDQTGDYQITFRAIDNPSNICSSDETTFTLTITASDNAVVFAGLDEVVCEGEDINLEAIIGSVYTNVSWTIISGSGLLTQDPIEPEKATYAPSPGETGTVQFSVLATDINGIAPDKSDNVIYTINALPTAQIISGDRTICDDGSQATITISLTGIGPWDVTYNDGIDDILIEGITTPTFNLDVDGRVGETVGYSLVSVSENNQKECAGIIQGSPVSITRNALPTATITSGDVVLCDDGGSAEIIVELTGTGPWDLIWNENGTPNFISNITSSPHSFLVNGIPGEDVIYSVTSVFENDGALCANAVIDQQVVVSRNERPTADLSGSVVLCEGESTELAFVLSGTGPWEVTFSDGITNTTFETTINSFNQVYDVNPPVGATSYSLVEVLDLGTGCVSQAGDLTGGALVEVKPTIVVDVGANKTILENQSVLFTATATGGFSSIEWSTDGNGIFSPPDALNSTYIPEADETGTFTIRLTATDADNVCPETFDELTLDVLPEDAVTVFAGTGYTICQGELVPVDATIGSAYEEVFWSGGLGFFNDSDNPTTTYNPSANETGEVILTIQATDTDGIFPEKTSQIIITILETPLVDAGDDQITCQGSSVQLNAALTGSNSSISWATDGGGTFTNINGLTTFYIPADDETGDVLLTITAEDPLGLCTTVTDEVIITFKEEIAIAVSEEIVVCQGFDINLAPQVQGANLTYSWTSSGIGTFNDNSTRDVVYTPGENETGRFNLFITASDPEGICDPVTSFFQIDILPRIEVEAPERVETCQGTPVTINASVFGTFSDVLWSTNGDGTIDDATANSITYSPSSTSTGEHILTIAVADANGLCAAVSREVIVDIKEEIAVFAGEDKVSLQRQTVDINDATVSGNFSRVQWVTNGSGVFSDPNSVQTQYIPTDSETGDITVQLTAFDDSGLCTQVLDQAIITINPFVPIPEFSLDPESVEEGCFPLTVSFVNETQFGTPLGYSWDFGDGVGSSTEESPTYTFFRPGTYTVTLIAKNDLGEDATVVKEELITVFPAPSPAFEVEEEVVFFPDPVKLINLSQGASEYNWEFGDGNISNEFEPEHVYEQPGNYDITLTAINEFGCEETFILQSAVEIRPGGDVKVPSAFSPNPNGSSGGNVLNGNQNNDVFIPVFEGVSKFKMQIFNRWGELLFQSVNENVGWDGYVRGVLSPQGIYIYKIELEFSDGRTRTLVGDVTLVK